MSEVTSRGDEPATQHQRLHSGVTQLEAIISAASDREWLRRPAAQGWSLAELTAHVTEMLPYWSGQVAAVARSATAKPAFGRTHEDPDRLAAVQRGSASDRLEALDRLRIARAEAETTLASVPPDGWSSVGVHSRRGPMTAAEILDQFLVEHVREHVGQAERIHHAVADLSADQNG